MKRIEICGGIAAGKTTLARLLTDGTDYSLALENFRANPFWDRFYQNPKLYAAEKNICFLPQHTGEIKSYSDQSLLVCDYAVFQDLAYASLLAVSGHLEIMNKLFDHLYRPLSPPTLIIYLTCDPNIQLERIRARAREEEQSFTLEYLDSLNKAIPKFLYQTMTDHTQIHTIPSDQVDFVYNKSTRTKLREQIFNLIK